MSANQFERLATLHKALSDETRVRVVNVLLALGELCVCDIEAGLDITQSKTSRHLAVLRQAGLVDLRRDGTWIYYRVHPDLSDATAAVLAGIRESLAGSPDADRDIARTRRLRRSCGAV